MLRLHKTLLHSSITISFSVLIKTILLAIAVVALPCCRRTVASRTFNDTAFDGVRLGESVEVVVDKCGLPLRCVEIDPNNLGVVVKQTDQPTRAYLTENLAASSDHQFRLYYTLQANPRLSYARREILIYRAQVKEVISSWVEE
jgi:hypothetical protein